MKPPLKSSKQWSLESFQVGEYTVIWESGMPKWDLEVLYASLCHKLPSEYIYLVVLELYPLKYNCISK